MVRDRVEWLVDRQQEGEPITIGPETLFTVVGKDEASGMICVEFKHDGKVCRVWAPEDDFEKTVKH